MQQHVCLFVYHLLFLGWFRFSILRPHSHNVLYHKWMNEYSPYIVMIILFLYFSTCILSLSPSPIPVLIYSSPYIPPQSRWVVSNNIYQVDPLFLLSGVINHIRSLLYWVCYSNVAVQTNISVKRSWAWGPNPICSRFVEFSVHYGLRWARLL